MWAGGMVNRADRQRVPVVPMIRAENVRCSISGVWSLLAAFFVVAGLLFAGAASGDEAPLVLSNENLGMTAEGIAAEAAALEAEKIELARVANPPEENEWVDASPVSQEAAAAECPDVVAEVAGGIGFETCVEAAIRGGNAFAESSSVCRAVFPDQAATTE